MRTWVTWVATYQSARERLASFTLPGHVRILSVLMHAVELGGAIGVVCHRLPQAPRERSVVRGNRRVQTRANDGDEA